MPDIPQQLIDAVRSENDRLVPFVGAGLSVSVRPGLFPDWNALIERMEAELRGGGVGSRAATERASTLRQQGRLVDAAEELVEALTNARFAPLIRTAFDRRLGRQQVDLSAPGAVWRLGSELVITTNYDSVLEWPYWWVREPVVTIHNDDEEKLTAIQGDRSLRHRHVWHLHGKADRPETIVLSRSAYEALYGEAETRRHRFAFETLRRIVTTRPLLFVGFSLDDPYLVRQLQDVLELSDGNSPLSWLLLRRPRPGDDAEVDVADLLCGTHVEVVYYEDFGVPFVQFLHQLAIRAHGEPPPDARLSELSIPPPRRPLLEELCALTADLILDPTEIARAYNAQVSPATGERLPSSGDAWTHLREAVHRLAADMPAADGTARLPAMVRALLPCCPAPRRAALSGWLGRAADVFGRPADGIAVAPPPALEAPYVLVVLRDDPPAAGWRARSWLFGAGAPDELFDGEVAYRRAQLDRLLYDLLVALEERDIDPKTVDLAFQGPRSLLAVPVHCERPTAEGAVAEPTIGATCRVTLRAARPSGRRAVLARQRAWRSWKVGAADCLVLSRFGDAVPQGRWAAWIDSPPGAGTWSLDTLRDPALALIALPSPPSLRDARLEHDPLESVLQTGLPVAVWARPPLSSAAAETLIRNLLADTEAGQLPEELRRRRGRAANTDDPNHCLSLLWEDADRIAPTADPDNRLSLAVETA